MMFEHSHHNIRHNKIIFILGVAIALGFWLAEGMLHLFIFDRHGIANMLLPSNTHELWMRSLEMCTIIGFSIYVQLIVNKLHENKERYRALFEGAPDAIFLADVESGEILDANPTASKLLLRHREEIIGLHQSQLHPPAMENDSTRLFTEHIEKVRKENDAPLVEHTVIRSDGMEVPVEIAAQIVPINGKPVIQGIFRDLTERKKVQLELESSNKRLTTVLDSLDTLVYVSDMDKHEILFINKYGRDNWGDITGETCCKTLQPEQVGPCEFCTNDKLINKDGKPTGVYKWECQNLTNRQWYDCRDLAIQWTDGRLVRMEIATNITERKEAEEALQRSETNLRESQEVGNVGSWSMDLVTNEEIWSDHIYRLLDLNTEEVKPCYEEFIKAVHPDDREIIKEAIKKSITNKESYETEFRVIRKDGTERWMHSQGKVQLDDTGNPVRLVGIGQDITERKKAAEAIKESEEKYRHLFSTESDAIIVFDAQTFQMIDVNNAGMDLYGYSKEEFLKLKIQDISAEEEKTIRSIKQLLYNGQGNIPLRYHKKKDGTVFPVEISPGTFTLKNRKVLCGIIRDITERKKAQEALQRQSKLLDSIRFAQSLFITGDDPKPVFESLLETLVEITDSEYGFLDEVLRDENGRLFKKSLALSDISWDDQSHKLYEQLKASNLEFRNLNNLASVPAVSGKLVISNDPIRDSRSGGIPEGHPPIRAFMGIPMFFGGELVGVAGVANRDGGYDQEIASFLDTFISTCASIIQAVRDDRERQQIAKELAESEEKYRRIVEDQTEFVVRWLPDGTRTFVNDSYCRYYGISHDEAIGTSFFPQITEDFRETIKNRIESLTPENPVWSSENKTIRPDGTIVWNQWTDRAFFDKEGKLIEFQSVGRDITKSRKAETLLQESEEKFRTLFEGANDAIFVLEVIDNNLRFKECNSRTETMFGCIKETIIGKSPVDFSPTVQPDGKLSIEKVTELCTVALTGEPQHFEWKHCRLDGIEFYTEVTLNRIDISGKSCLQAIVRDITERKQLEADMHLQSEIAKNIAEGIYLVSTKDLKIVYANSTMERMFGYAPGEMTGRPVSIINAPAGGNPEQTAQEIEAALKEKGQYRGDVLTVKKDGTLFWSRTTISIMYHPEYGDVYISLQADITERKEMEAALRESEEKFKALFHQAGDYAFVLDPHADVDLMIVDANESACRAHGYSRDELIGKSVLDLDLRTFSEEERARMDQQLLAGETLHFETTHRRKDGSTFPIEVAAKAVRRIGKTPLIFSTERDITERKQALEALRKSEERYRELYEQSPLGYQSLDAEGCFVEVNQAWLDMLGYSREEIISQWYGNFLAPHQVELFRERFPHFKKCGNVHTEFEMKRKDGSIITVSVAGKIGYDEKGQFKQTHCILNDITKRKQAELQLRQNAEHMAILLKTHKALTKSLDLTEILQILTDSATAILDGGTAAVYLLNEDVLHLGATTPPLSPEFPDNLRRAFPADHPHIQKVINSGSVLVIPDAKTEDLTEAERKVCDMRSLRTIVFFPLIGSKGVMGVYIVSSTNAPRKFAESQINLCHTLGSQASIAIENARLYQSVQAELKERQRAEAAMQESENRYRSVVENAGEGIVVTQDGFLKFINPHFIEISGYSEDEFMSRPFIEFIHPDDREAVMEIHNKRFKGEEIPSVYNFRTFHKQGNIIWLENNGILIEWDGKPASLNFLRDITDRKKAEEAVRNIAEGISAATGEVFFRLLAQYLAKTLDADYAFVGELSGEQENKVKTLAVCAHGEIVDNIEYELTDTPCENVVGKRICSYPSDVQAQFPLDKLLQEMGVESYVGAPLFDSSGHPLGIAVVLDSKPLNNPKQAESMLQIFAVRASAELERKKAETAMAESEKKFRQFFENEPEYCYMVSPQGTILEANHAALNTLGYSLEELAGKPLMTIYAPESHQRMHQLINQWEQTGEIRNEEMIILAKDGGRRTVLLSATQMLDEQGKPLHSISIQRDITERKEATEALREERDKLQALIDGISHAGISIDIIGADYEVLFQNKVSMDSCGKLMEKPCYEYFMGLEKPCEECPVAKAIKENKPVETEQRGTDGEIYYVIAAPLSDADGTVNKAIEIVLDVTERKQAEIELKRQRYYLAKAQELGKIGTWELDIEKNKLIWTDENYRIFGVDIGTELTYETFLGCVHPDDREYVDRKWKAAMNAEPYDIEHRLLVENQVKWVREKADVTFEENGNPVLAIGFTQDITARKQSEEALRMNEKRYRAIVEDQTELICRCLPDGTLTFVNEAYCRYFAKNRNELIGQKFMPFIPTERHQKVKEHFLSMEPNNPVATHEHHVIMPNGDVRWHQWTNRAIFDDAGNVVEFQGVGRDFTKQKMAEEELRQSEKRLRSLSEAAFEGIAFTENGILVDANQAFAKIYDYRLEELKGSHVIELVAPEHRKIAMKNMRSGCEGTYEHKGLRKDGSLIDLEIHGRDIEYQGRKVRLTAIRDITEHKLAERKIKDYQAQLKSLASELSLAEERERRRIATGIHDDIAQKLAMAKFSLQSLQASVKDTNISVSLEKQCELMSQVVADARSLTFELGNPVLYQVGLEAAVESYLTERIQDEFGLECKFKSEGSKSSIDEDVRVVLFQAIRELLANVIKHAKANMIEVCIKNTEDNIQIFVKDDGVGFDPDKIGPNTLKRGGFGLFNIRERLEYFGGNLEIESRPKRGTRVTMTVAIKADAVAEQKEMLL